METAISLERESSRSLDRLLPRLEAALAGRIAADPQAWHQFKQRLVQHFPALFELYFGLYNGHYDFFYHLEDLLTGLGRSWFERPADLRALDAEREADPRWFQSNRMLGGVIYVDLFAGDLAGVRAKIPYFQELGLTYLHLMPLFQAPEEESDGGYAVSSYRDVNARLGSMSQLAELSRELRAAGISLVVDLVFNHTSDEHLWARRALAGDEEYQAYYRMFPDRTLPDAYERSLREIFPDEHPGAFTYRPEIKKWVWTTFHRYQWDLNYANPPVFNRMAEELLFLANRGVEVLRFDAVAFIWKEMSTGCENLPGAHRLIRAFNRVARIAAPGLLFKSEAIVHPDDVVAYISPEECQLSYNPLLMALLWNTLATREVNLLSQALGQRHSLPQGCSWVNYVRCHDDIGWTFSDEDALKLGVNGADHRRFLNNFYTGRFPGAFARGLPFQENPKTGDCRISGTCASLAGLEKALAEETGSEVELAIRRILLIHGLILTAGGLPLIYLGDEVGTLNDYSFHNDPGKARDSRWVHRPATDWEKLARRSDPNTIEGRVFQGLQNLAQLRRRTPALANGPLEVFATGNPHVLGFVRSHEHERVIILANFHEQPQTLPGNLLRLYGLGYRFKNLLTGETFGLQDLTLEALQLLAIETIK